MSATGLDVFDKTLQTTHVWLDEMTEEMNCDKRVAWHGLGAVLRAVRDRVPANLAAHLGAQLPLLVRGIYYDGWQPDDAPDTWRSVEEFVAAVGSDLGSMPGVDIPATAQAVFHVINHHVDPGQVTKIRHALPAEVQSIWPDNNGGQAAQGTAPRSGGTH